MGAWASGMSLSVCSTPPPPVDRGTQVVIRQKAQTAMQSAGVKSYAWTISWPTQGRFYTKKKSAFCLVCFVFFWWFLLLGTSSCLLESGMGAL